MNFCILALLLAAVWTVPHSLGAAARQSVSVSQTALPTTHAAGKTNLHTLPLLASTTRLLVKPKPATGSARNRILQSLENLHGAKRAKVLRRFDQIGDLQVLEFEPGVNLDGLIEAYKSSGLAEYVEPDYLQEAFALPSDPSFTNQWSLQNTGQPSPSSSEPNGTPGADIHAVEAWDISASVQSIIIAVVDTGVRYTHEDLAGNMDIHGINAIANTSDPMDDNGHGTHVAGIIAAMGNNGLGISGIAWSARIMACKFLNASGTGATSDAITCIDYARAHGASIINASWGNSVYSQALYDAINRARADGIIFVAAAGNAADNCDQVFFYPAGYHLDNVVSVMMSWRGSQTTDSTKSQSAHPAIKFFPAGAGRTMITK
jgi:subtilisin family serine protease